MAKSLYSYKVNQKFNLKTQNKEKQRNKSEIQVAKELSFIKEIGKLFDIVHAENIKLNRVEEDKDFFDLIEAG